MAATTTARLTSIAHKLFADHEQVVFRPGKAFYWAADEQVVYYSRLRSPDDLALLFHELGHALLGHAAYGQDVQLLAMERAAWQTANELAGRYGVEIGADIEHTSLESYRDWLHQRSRCPSCSHGGLQGARSGEYHCVGCGSVWRANEARLCRLRRTKKETTRKHPA